MSGAGRKGRRFVPELPEVETVARQLDPLVRGRDARRLLCLDARLEMPRATDLRGFAVRRVARVGKQVAFEFVSGGGRERTLVVHLRMTGRLVWDPADGEVRPHHLRARLELAGGGVDFIDPRRFGTLAWKGAVLSGSAEAMDPLSSGLDARLLASLLHGSRQPLKPWLMRQDRLVGIGNIYASEILFEAGLSPFRQAGSLTADETGALVKSVKRVLRRAIRHCGTTFSDFQDAHGVTGSYQSKLRVYGREGEPCRACGAPIERVVQAQRSTYYCTGACQSRAREAEPEESPVSPPTGASARGGSESGAKKRKAGDRPACEP